jgi:hypothetical protein
MTKIDSYRQNQYAEQVRGSQVASIAHAGGRMDDPTSQAILRDTTEQSSLDAWLIRYGGEMKAREYEMAASDARRQGKNALKAGRMNAFASILGGAGNTYTAYQGMVA